MQLAVRQPLVEAAASRVLLLVIGVGIAARVCAFVLDQEIYHDDAYLMNNVLAKSYGELAGPLANNQAAPPAFLWASKWLLDQTHGDWGGRLLPLLAGMSAIFIFYLAASEVLSVLAARLATALMAASHAPIIYCVRAKPYAIDLLISTIVTLMLLRWLRCPKKTRYIVVLAAIAPVVFWFSYPSTFVLAGAAIITFCYAVSHRTFVSRSFWPAWAALALSGMVGGVILHHYHLARCMTAEHTRYLHEFWAEAFPPLRNPLRFLLWLLTTHTGRMYAYPIGEAYLASTIPFFFWLTGCVSLLKHHQRWLLATLLTPQGLLFLAAAAGKYPYGGHARLSLFLAPAMCMVIAAGVLQVARWFTARGRAAFLTVVSLALLTTASLHVLGTGLQWWGERGNQSIKRGLAGLLDANRPGDIIRRTGKPAPLEGGGAVQQIGEYYLQLMPWPAPS